jgi:ATP-dependent phosphofructokinase / diphosphate-dependent phosphofructokinase
MATKAKSNKKITKKVNVFYAQSGGVTGVINSTARGVIEEALKHKDKIGKVFIARHGIQGLLLEELYDMSKESKKAVAGLHNIPGGAFGSCRYKLRNPKDDLIEYKRIVEVCKAHNIGYFLYNGGNDSADTTYKLSQVSKKMGYEMVCIGIPKTMDNDLACMDVSPGYPSVAKFIATSSYETGVDIKSMAPATQIYIMETMGRHAGWIAAASGLAKKQDSDPPHIILLPEVLFDKKKFLAKVNESVKKYGYCHIVTAESLRDLNGKHIAETGQKDAFGHVQLGGMAPILAQMIHEKFGYQYHYSIADYIQRASRHLGSPVDLKQAYAVGAGAVKLALAGKNGMAPVILRKPGKKYSWKIGEASLKKIANTERNMPRNYITKDGFGITKKCYDYLYPFIQGEDFPPFKNGLPHYETLKLKLAPKKLAPFELLK